MIDRWPALAHRRDLLTGVFFSVLAGTLAVLAALWLVAAVIVGTVVIGRALMEGIG